MNITLPHWAAMALGLAAIIVTWVMQQASSGQLVLPATVVSVLVVVKTVIELLTPSVSPKANLAAVVKTGVVNP